VKKLDHMMNTPFLIIRVNVKHL